MADKNLRLRISEIGAKKVKRSLDAVDTGLKNVASSALQVGAAYFSARGIINGLQKSIELSGKFQGISAGFQNLGRQSGFTTSALDKFIDATDGTISSLELMEMANNSMLLGITDSEDQMAEMFDIAQRLAKSLGQDTRFGIESLVTGLGRQSKLMLDNLGIMVDIEKANEEYAESIGKTASQLTDQEKKQAFVNTTLATAKELVEGIGDESLTTADTIAQLQTAVDEAAISVGNALAPAINVAVSSLTNFIKQYGTAVQLVKLSDTDLGAVNSSLNGFARALGTVQMQGGVTTKGLQAGFKGLQDLLRQYPAAKELIQPILDQYDEEIKKREQIIETGVKQTESEKLQLRSIKEEKSLMQLADIQIAETQEKIGKDAEDRRNKELKFVNDLKQAKQDQVIQELKQAALVQGSAMDAMKAVVRAESMEAVAGLIASILKNVPFPFNTILAAGAGATAAGLIDKGLAQFATGGDFITDGPQMIMVGDNAGGRERVQVTPLSSPNINGPQQGISVNFNAPVTNDEYVRDFIIPEIKKATRMNLA